MQGIGPVYLYLVDAVSTKIISEKKYILEGKENKVHMISVSNSSFQNLRKAYGVLSLHMHTDINIIKVVSVEFNMNL
jgi:hypothetical protein